MVHLINFERVNVSFFFFLFEIISLFEFFDLSPNSVFLTKSALSFLLAKFDCTNFAAKLYAVNLLYYGAVICLLWSGILFSTAVRAIVVANLVVLGILFLTSSFFSIKSSINS